MEELAVYLVIIGIIVLIIIYIVLPIIGILLGIGGVILAGIAISGLISGLVVGVRNFFIVVKEAHDSLP